MSNARQLAANLPREGGLSNRNLIINGAMQVAQRGSLSSFNTDGGFLTCDRFKYDKTGGTGPTTSFDVSKSSDAPEGFSSSLKLDVVTADTVASNEFSRLEYVVEAQDVSFLNYGTSSAQQVTLSFWVKSNKTGDFATTFYTQDTGRNIGSTYTINSADTWEYKTITFAGDTGGGGIDNNNGAGIQIDWVLQAGSDWASSSNTSWAAFASTRLAYGHTATVGQSTSDYFQITGVQLEVGDTATPFEHRSYGDELARCQRYYQQIAANDDYDFLGTGYVENGSTIRIFIRFNCDMRATPTGSSSGSYRSAFGTNADQDITFQNMANAGLQSARVQFNGSSFAVGEGCMVMGYSGAALKFDAEL